MPIDWDTYDTARAAAITAAVAGDDEPAIRLAVKYFKRQISLRALRGWCYRHAAEDDEYPPEVRARARERLAEIGM